MFQYRAVLVRLRQGDSDRDIARARLMGRPKVAALRALAMQQGWLAPEAPLPEDGEIAAVLGHGAPGAHHHLHRRAVSRPRRALVRAGCGRGGDPRGAVREHGYSGSYSAVRRMLAALNAAAAAEATVPLEFAPGEAAQVDFGAGPLLLDPAERAAPHLGVRDDAVLLAPSVRRVRLGPDGGHLARLSPPRLRMVRRRAGAAHHRQPQVRHHSRLCPRPAGAARLRRVRRRLRLQDRPVSAGAIRRRRASSSRGQVRQGQLPAAPQLPRSRRSERPGPATG